MNGVEDTEHARELKQLLCGTCYRSLIDWISGRVTNDTGDPVRPFAPCDHCAPQAQAWLEKNSRG